MSKSDRELITEFEAVLTSQQYSPVIAAPIRSWLGHVSLDTTNHYAKANLETKRKALEQVDVPATATHPPSWKRDASLLAWLDSF